MKNVKYLCLLAALSVCSVSVGCNDNDADGRKEAPFIYLIQAAFDSPYAVPGNYKYESGSEVISVPLSIHRAGLDALEAYSVKLEVLDEAVEGTQQLPEEAYVLPLAVNSPEGVRTCGFSLDLKLGFLRKDHAGAVYSLVLAISDPSKYAIEESMAKVAIRIDPVALLKDSDLYYDWELLFSEEFEGAGVDERNWSIYNEEYGHSNIGVLKPEAFSVKEGILNLTCYMDPKYPRVVTGGMKHKTPFTYGRIEFRAKSMLDPDGYVGGVILTWPASERWPQDGEMDIYEILSPQSPVLNTFIHHPDFADPSKDVHVQFTHTGLDRTQWHTFRVDWFPDHLYLYVDGNKVWELTDVRRIPQTAHRFVIQSGSKVNVVNHPVMLEVDYVRVYQVKE